MQLVIKTSLLRELDEYKLIEAYAHLVYVNSTDVENDIKIKDNLIKILDLNGNDITVVDSGTVTKKKIEAGWFINDDTYKQVVVYVMVGDETSTYTSDVINISVKKEETKKGGCKSDTVIKYIIASSTALALVLVIARKKK